MDKITVDNQEYLSRTSYKSKDPPRVITVRRTPIKVWQSTIENGKAVFKQIN